MTFKKYSHIKKRWIGKKNIENAPKFNLDKRKEISDCLTQDESICVLSAFMILWIILDVTNFKQLVLIWMR